MGREGPSKGRRANIFTVTLKYIFGCSDLTKRFPKDFFEAYSELEMGQEGLQPTFLSTLIVRID